MTIDVEEFRKFLTIDKMSLDEELVQQADLFFRISEALTDAIDQRDALKEELAVVDADLDGEIRDHYEKIDQKIAEGAIKAQIKTDKKHKAAYKLYATAKNLADRLGAMKESFIQRSHMLKHLCELYTHNYFETSSIQGTSRTDAAVYQQQRKRLGDAREQRGQRK